MVDAPTATRMVEIGCGPISTIQTPPFPAGGEAALCHGTAKSVKAIRRISARTKVRVCNPELTFRSPSHASDIHTRSLRGKTESSHVTGIDFRALYYRTITRTALSAISRT